MPRSNAWSAEEESLLRKLYPKSRAKDNLAASFPGRTAKAIRSRAKVLHLSKGNRAPWTRLQDDLLRKLYPHMPTKAVARAVGHTVASTYRRASHVLGLSKTEQYLNSPSACRLRRGDNVGAASRFLKGHVPANKGLRRPAGWAPGRMAETQFKKGQRSINYLPIGTVRKDSDGYLRHKIADGIGGFGNPTVWEYIHKRVWIDAHGPIPPGHRIWWKDGNHENCALENLELITDSEHMSRTTVHNLPKPLVQVIQLKGALNRRIRRLDGRNQEQNHGSTKPSVRAARSPEGQ